MHTALVLRFCKNCFYKLFANQMGDPPIFNIKGEFTSHKERNTVCENRCIMSEGLKVIFYDGETNRCFQSCDRGLT